MKSKSAAARLTGFAIAFVLALKPASADEVAQFYAGKTVNIVVGFEAGGFYSTFAVIFARRSA